VGIGLFLGQGLGQAMGAAVASTVSAHYFLVDVARVTVPPGTMLVAVVYGLGASVAGAWWPAREAAGIPPLDALRPPSPTGATGLPGTTRWLYRGLGAVAGSAAASGLALGPGPAGWSFVACFLWVTGFAMATPWLARRLARALGRLLAWQERRVVARLAVERFDRSLHRSAVTVAALMASLAMMIGVTTMVASFRGTVDAWVNGAMRADEFVAPAGNEVVGWQHFLPEAFVAAAERHPAVRRAETYRQALVRSQDGESFHLVAAGNPAFEGFRFSGGGEQAKIRAWSESGGAFATEPLARRLRLREGDTVRVPTPSGTVAVTVRGIYRDYSDDRGKLVVPREAFARWWGEDRVHSVALTWGPGTDAEAVRRELGEGWRLSWLSHAELRRRVFEVFDQTFAVTQALRGVAVVVAVLGVSLALGILVLERTREIGILRATGASRGQIRRMEWIEAGVIGLAGSGIGILCGLGMSVLLIRVVNPAFFGWTIDLEVPWAEVLAVPLWIVPVSMAAAAVPAFRAGRIPVAAAVRAE
jgi:putative ABC transport system permease protein